MIKVFRDPDAAALFDGGRGHAKWQSFARVARRKLLMLHAANNLSDLKTPPNNKLEQLKRDQAGQYAIRVNDQYRLCFTWRDGHAYDVEIIDYHD